MFYNTESTFFESVQPKKYKFRQVVWPKYRAVKNASI